MKKLILPMLITSTLAISACCDCKPKKSDANKSDAKAHSADHDHKHNDDNKQTVAKSATAGAVAAAGVLTLGDFDWKSKFSNKSSTDIGNSPYFTLPEGMNVAKSTDDNTNSNVTKFFSNDQINIYDGETVSKTKGTLSYLDITTKEGVDFNQTSFNQHVTDHMKSIGAVEFYNDTVPSDIAKKIGELEGISPKDYMSGDFTGSKLRQFALNHDNGQLIYQVMSDEKHGELGVIEFEGFKAISSPSVSEDDAKHDVHAKAEKDAKEEPKVEDIAKSDTGATVESQPTATDMKEQLNSNGKAIINIKFESAKAKIRTDNLPILEQIHSLLKEDPNLKLSVEGHTDSSGKAEMNQKLSVWRAKEVKAELEKKGIESSRLKATGFGADKPIADNDTKENRAKNRRVELVKFN